MRLYIVCSSSCPCSVTHSLVCSQGSLCQHCRRLVEVSYTSVVSYTSAVLSASTAVHMCVRVRFNCLEYHGSCNELVDFFSGPGVVLHKVTG